jgi:hypothetical protein
MARTRLGRAAAALLLLVPAAAGCTGGGNTGAPLPAPGRGPAGASSGSAHGAEAAALDLLAQVDKATDRANVACMEANGFHVHPVADTDGPTTAPGEAYPFREPLTVAQAEDVGYTEVGELSRDPDPPPPAPDAFHRLSAAEQRRYYVAFGHKARYILPDGTAVGVIRGGCAERVMVAIHQDLDRYLWIRNVTANAPNDIRERTEQDPRVADALRAWSRCMRERGYPDLATLDDAVVLATRYYLPRGGPRVAPEQARSKERELAVADATCADSSGVETTLRVVWQQTRDTYYVEHETDFVALRDLLRSALTAAQRLLESGATPPVGG